MSNSNLYLRLKQKFEFQQSDELLLCLFVSTTMTHHTNNARVLAQRIEITRNVPKLEARLPPAPKRRLWRRLADSSLRSNPIVVPSAVPSHALALLPMRQAAHN